MQFGLFKLFLFITFTCIVLGMFRAIGPFLSLLLYGFWVNVAIIKWMRFDSIFNGAIAGCVFAGLIFMGCEWVAGKNTDAATLTFGYLFYPALGMAIGVVWTGDRVIREFI